MNALGGEGDVGQETELSPLLFFIMLTQVNIVVVVAAFLPKKIDEMKSSYSRNVHYARRPEDIPFPSNVARAGLLLMLLLYRCCYCLGSFLLLSMLQAEPVLSCFCARSKPSKHSTICQRYTAASEAKKHNKTTRLKRDLIIVYSSAPEL